MKLTNNELKSLAALNLQDVLELLLHGSGHLVDRASYVRLKLKHIDEILEEIQDK